MADDQKVRLLEARVSLLEKHVKFLLDAFGLDRSVFRDADDDVLLELYRDAVLLLSMESKKIDIEPIRKWSQILLQLSEYEFTRLQSLVNYENTWEPFYQLSIKMMTSVRQDKRIAEDITLQHLYALLDKARATLRDSAIAMIKSCNSKVPVNIKVLLRDHEIIDLLPR